MSIRVLINGARGKMGQEAVKAIQADPELKLVGTGQKGDSLRQLILETEAQVVVDLTTPQSVFENTLIVLQAKARPVIGTSGLTESQISSLQKEATKLKIGGIIAPNFSISAVLMIHLAEIAAQFLHRIEIIESHHDGKVDAPSGTALQTAQRLAQARSAAPFMSSEQPLARGQFCHQIPIHSIRLPGQVAHQKIWFGSLGETLRIEHDCIERKAFMPGLILCCKKAPFLKQLFYGLDHLLFPEGQNTQPRLVDF